MSTFARVWTRDNIVAAILAEHDAGHDLSYTQTTRRVPSLIRAAERIYGSWAAAVTAAGFDYASIRRYQQWSVARIIERIRAWHEQGADLSWRHVSTELDPPLAAAVYHGHRFASWEDALRAADLDPEEIARYRSWTLRQVHIGLTNLHESGVVLTRENLIRENPALLAAAYRVGHGLVAERRRALASTAA